MTDREQKIIFARNLSNILSERKLTQLEVSNAIGVSHQTFNTWYQGKAIPRMGKIQLLADYFHIKMSDLIEEPAAPASSSPAAVSGSSTQPALVLSDLEEDLIKAFRNASPDLRAAACAVLGVKRESESALDRSIVI